MPSVFSAQSDIRILRSVGLLANGGLASATLNDPSLGFLRRIEINPKGFMALGGLVNSSIGVVSLGNDVKAWKKPGNESKMDDVLRLAGDVLMIAGGVVITVGGTKSSGGLLVGGLLGNALGWLLKFIGHEVEA